MGFPPTADALPDALVSRDQWVCWRTQQRDEKPTKVPIIPDTTQFASTTDPETWRPFQTAREAVTTTSVDGVGFVFTAGDSLIGVDLDDCRDPDTGEPTAWASQIISQLDSYTEVSPSGTGYHILIRGTLPEGRNRAGKLEMYDRSRFFTVTGDHVTETPTTVADRTTAIESVHAEELASAATTQPASSTPTSSPSDQPATDDQPSSDPTTASGPAALDDETLLDRARTAANGAKFSRLWGGDTSGYASHSEADMALCRLLAFWTDCDRSRMDRLFRRSGLARDKWDAVHYADGTTYGAKTIERAIARTDDGYTPPETTDSAATAATGSDDAATAGETSTPSTATAAVDTTPQASPTHADSTPADPPLSPPDRDSTAGTSSGAATTATTSPPASQDVTEPLARIDELTARVEALMEENEALRADLAAERTRRQELERELESERASWWPPCDP